MYTHKQPLDKQATNIHATKFEMILKHYFPCSPPQSQTNKERCSIAVL